MTIKISKAPGCWVGDILRDANGEIIIWPHNVPRADEDEDDRTAGEMLGSCGVRVEVEAEANMKAIAEKAAAQAKLRSVFDLKQTVWSYYWPEGARVPRVNPYKRRVREPNTIMESR